jgi:hypothetical protein
MTTGTWLLLGALGATAVLSSAGCDSAFDGPYPCAPGFASCTTTSSCETLLMSDGTSCGACGKQCSPGAACSGGTCGTASPFEPTASPGFLQLSGKNLAWAANATTNASLHRVSTGGGTPAIVASSLLTCGSGAPFAIDDANVYYFTSSTTSGPTSAVTLVREAIGGSGSPTAIASMSACGALFVSDGTLYVASTANGSTSGPTSATFYSVPTRGGAPTSLATVPDWSGAGFVVSGGSIYFNAGCAPDGRCSVLGTVPVAGGPVAYTSSINGVSDSSGQGPVAADASNVYAVMGGWNCNDNGNGDNGNGGSIGSGSGGCGQSGQACCAGAACAGGVSCSADGTCPSAELTSALTGGTSVVAFPVNGAQPTVLTTTHDGSPVTGVAVDSSNVYWVTSTTAWAVPLAGGTAVAIAGNLGTPPTPCGNGGTTQASNAATIVSDGTNVYIASPSRNAIYRVPVPK